MIKDGSTLLDFQNNWAEIVDKGQRDYNSLTSDERIWYSVETLIGQVDNGGLISFYYNSYGAHVSETIDDFQKIGFSDIADLMRQINELFPKGHPSSEIEERNNVISNWANGKYDSLFASLDRYFYDREKELEQKLIQHIQASGLIG